MPKHLPPSDCANTGSSSFLFFCLSYSAAQTFPASLSFSLYCSRLSSQRTDFFIFFPRQEKPILYHCHIWGKVFSPKGKLPCNYNGLVFSPNILHQIHSILFLDFHDFMISSVAPTVRAACRLRSFFFFFYVLMVDLLTLAENSMLFMLSCSFFPSLVKVCHFNWKNNVDYDHREGLFLLPRKSHFIVQINRIFNSFLMLSYCCGLLKLILVRKK